MPAPLDRPPLSMQQRRLWFLWQSGPETLAYHTSRVLELCGPLDRDALGRALEDVVERHEPLRTRIGLHDGLPWQDVQPPSAIEIPCSTPVDVSADDEDRIIRQHVRAVRQPPFDLRDGRPLRVGLLRLRPERHFLVVVVHQSAADGGSFAILERDLGECYRARTMGRSAALPSLPVRYIDFARQQHQRLSGDRYERLLAYWRQRLDGAQNGVLLPTDRQRLPGSDRPGARLGGRLDRALVGTLDAIAEESGASRFMLLLTAFQCWLGRQSGQRDLAVATPAANRHHPNLRNMVGLFNNTLMMRATLTGEASFRQMLAHARRAILSDFAHQELPFDHLVELLRPGLPRGHHPRVGVSFVYHTAPRASGDWGSVTVRRWPQEIDAVRFDLEVHAFPMLDGIECAWMYNRDLWDPDHIEYLTRSFRSWLSQLGTARDVPLRDVPLVDDEDRRKLSAWSLQGTVVQHGTVLDLFARQVAQSPDQNAVECDGRRLSYQQLDARTNVIARLMARQGGLRATPIGLFVPRSMESALGVLAILKSGGVCVPVDPSWSMDRLNAVARDAGIQHWLTLPALADRLRPLGGHRTLLDRDLDSSSGDDADHSAMMPTPGDPAIVFRAAGSTRGTALSHRALHAMICAQLADQRLGRAARTLHFAPPSFVVSLQEMFATWSSGGCLVVPGEAVRQQPELLLACVRDEGIERLFLPASVLDQLAQLEGQVPLPALQDVVTAGNRLVVTPALRAFAARQTCRLHTQYGSDDVPVAAGFLLPEDAVDWPDYPPIGRPTTGTGVFVLDDRRQLVSIGAPGELWLAVDGQQYRTGDVGRWNREGLLEFLDRAEPQHGRTACGVDTGEIEQTLRALPAVRDAVVVVSEVRPREPRLTAYLVGDNQVPPGPADVREALAARWPEFGMPECTLPVSVIALAAMPLGPDGTLNRSALPPAVGTRAHLETNYCAPRSALEARLAEIWQADLRLSEPPGIHDDLRDLGGHSLLAARLLDHIEDALACRVPVDRFFAQPTIAHLAGLLEQSNNGEDGVQTTGERVSATRWSLPEPLGHKLLSHVGSWRGTRVHPSSLVIGRHPGGRRTPLFWVFQGEAEWAQLAKYLGPDQPLYGMRSGHLIMDYREDNIQAMALAYVEEIQALATEGPLFIGGNCQGAVIAEAVAQHLWRRRRQIPLLFLMEWAFPFQPYPGPVALLFGTDSSVANPALRGFQQPELAWQRHFAAHRVEMIQGRHGAFFLEPNVQVLAGVLARLMAESQQRPAHHYSGKPISLAVASVDAPPRMESGRQTLMQVTVHNTGAAPWAGTARTGLTLGYRWLTAVGPDVPALGGRAALPPLAPGDTTTIPLEINAPLAACRAQLQIAIVEDGVLWYDRAPHAVELTIDVSARVTW